MSDKVVFFFFGTFNTTYILSDCREMLVLNVHLRCLSCICVIRCVKAFTFGSKFALMNQLTDMNKHFEGVFQRGPDEGMKPCPSQPQWVMGRTLVLFSSCGSDPL